jgi:cytochrome c-type biogenesis protein CcmH
LQGEPEQLLERALKLDPNNIRALSLMGSAAFDRRDYEHAIGYWNRVLPLVAPDSKIAQSTSSSIDEAKALQKDSSETSIIRLPNAGNDSSVDK